jgi:hypothetical protein
MDGGDRSGARRRQRALDQLLDEGLELDVPQTLKLRRVSRQWAKIEKKLADRLRSFLQDSGKAIVLDRAEAHLTLIAIDGRAHAQQQLAALQRRVDELEKPQSQSDLVDLMVLLYRDLTEGQGSRTLPGPLIQRWIAEALKPGGGEAFSAIINLKPGSKPKPMSISIEAPVAPREALDAVAYVFAKTPLAMYQTLERRRGPKGSPNWFPLPQRPDRRIDDDD